MRKKIYIVLFLLVPSIVLGAEKTYTVAGHSMEPALMPGYRVVVSPSDNGAFSRGELVAVSLKGMRTPMVKRVVAIGGDELRVRDNAIFVNGEKVRDISMRKWGPTMRQLEHYGWRVPEGNIFILGDNPENSRDSRRLGLLSVSQVSGRIVRIIKPAAE